MASIARPANTFADRAKDFSLAVDAIRNFVLSQKTLQILQKLKLVDSEEWLSDEDFEKIKDSCKPEEGKPVVLVAGAFKFSASAEYCS